MGFTHLVVMTDRWIVLSHREEADRVKVFDHGGRFIRSLGRRGDGPGEFRRVRALAVGPHDSIYVMDSRLARLTVFGPGLDLARTAPIPVYPSEDGLHVLSDGSLLVNGRSPFGNGVEERLFRLSATGEVLEQPDPGRVSVPEARPRWRSFASSDSDVYWTADYGVYSLVRRSLEVGIEEDVQHDPGWFTGPGRTVEDPHRSGGTSEPSSSVLDISVDAENRVWVIGETPDPRWQTVLDDEGRVIEADGYIDSVIDVWDPTGRSLVCRRVFDGQIRGFAASDIVFRYREVGGFPRIDLYRASLFP